MASALNSPRVVRRGQHCLISLRGVALAGCAATAALALATRTHWLQRRDDDLERWIEPHRRRLQLVATVATQPGESYVHPFVAAGIAALILRAREGPAVRIVLPLSVASLGAIASHHAVKVVHRRPRPQVALRRRKTEAAFPSGHTTNATAVAATGGYLLAREGIADMPIMLTSVVAIAMCTGVSRVVLGWHWGSDVVGGWIAGLAVAAFSADLYEVLSVRMTA